MNCLKYSANTTCSRNFIRFSHAAFNNSRFTFSRLNLGLRYNLYEKEWRELCSIKFRQCFGTKAAENDIKFCTWNKQKKLIAEAKNQQIKELTSILDQIPLQKPTRQAMHVSSSTSSWKKDVNNFSNQLHQHMEPNHLNNVKNVKSKTKIGSKNVKSKQDRYTMKPQLDKTNFKKDEGNKTKGKVERGTTRHVKSKAAVSKSANKKDSLQSITTENMETMNVGRNFQVTHDGSEIDYTNEAVYEATLIDNMARDDDYLEAAEDKMWDAQGLTEEMLEVEEPYTPSIYTKQIELKSPDKKKPQVAANLPNLQELESMPMEQVKAKLLPTFSKSLLSKVTYKKLRAKAIAAEEDRQLALRLQEMKSFVQACVNAGIVNKAHAAVSKSFFGYQSQQFNKKYSEENKKTKSRKIDSIDNATNKTPPALDMEIYNVLLYAYGKKGDVVKQRNLFEQLGVLGLTPDPAAYTYVLLGVAMRRRHGEQASVTGDTMARLVLSDLEVAGVALTDLPVHTLPPHEASAVNALIAAVAPDYHPTRHKSPEGYDCSLLEYLNGGRAGASENPACGVLSAAELRRGLHQQVALQLRDAVVVTSVEPDVVETPRIAQLRARVTELHESWRDALLTSFKSKLKVEKLKSKGTYVPHLLPYLLLLPAEDYVSLLMQETLERARGHTLYFSPTLAQLQDALAAKVYRKHLLRVRAQHSEAVCAAYGDFLEEAYSGPHLHGNHRELWERALCARGLSTAALTVGGGAAWPPGVRRQLGRFLYGLILADVTVDVHILKQPGGGGGARRDVPVFTTTMRTRRYTVTEEIVPHPVVPRLYREAAVREMTFDPTYLPSLAPPLPWIDSDCGGDVFCTTELVRLPPGAGAAGQRLREAPRQAMYPQYDALNAISAVPWSINARVLDVAISVFNSGGNEALKIPAPVSALPDPPRVELDMPAEQKAAILQDRLQLQKERKETFSLWCTELYRLSIANQYRDRVFWFPHNLDFRGRSYAVPPHFNHLGGDLARSILMFAKGKPLGPAGLDWLKIHLINLTGLKKRSSNAERLAYADTIMEDILDSADHPLDGSLWWQRQEEPWQVLAACCEVAAALRCPAGAPSHVSHFPVHQDGSCNGLQHYAALGRDRAGANSVNLTPAPAPSDVYSDVVELVEARRRSDAAAEAHGSSAAPARALDGFVKRKVIKQTVMTTVYGVTQFGARKQIRGQLDSLAFPAAAAEPEHARAAAFYLADLTLACLQQMFTSTKAIQDWLFVCADLISNVCQRPVEWRTPLGLPVVQPYYRQRQLKLTKLERKAFRGPDKTRTLHVEHPNAMKQRNAFPPNFIHSLDAAHMMLTAIHALRCTGIAFVSVHDCYWTHAADVPVMNRICREQFVALHSAPILETLAADMVQRYKMAAAAGSSDVDQVQQVHDLVLHLLGRVPDRGDLDLNAVLESTYFFS